MVFWVPKSKFQKHFTILITPKKWPLEPFLAPEKCFLVIFSIVWVFFWFFLKLYDFQLKFQKAKRYCIGNIRPSTESSRHVDLDFLVFDIWKQSFHKITFSTVPILQGLSFYLFLTMIRFHRFSEIQENVWRFVWTFHLKGRHSWQDRLAHLQSHGKWGKLGPVHNMCKPVPRPDLKTCLSRQFFQDISGEQPFCAWENA